MIGSTIRIEIDLESFEKHYKDAKGFHRRAEQFLNEGQSSSVIFNVASIALERYLIAICYLYGAPPWNNTYASLMDIVEIIVDFPQDLNDEIRSIGKLSQPYLCSMEPYHGKFPEAADADRILSICDKVSRTFDQSRISAIRSTKKKGK
ncbi:MAG: hypothetical protein LKE46_00855 [Clostridium sp.]|jgi:HEPN domain-containing protein|uniref:hypothetical protein n=1 Tax=Clostridium sp. TaxID=1506 RepID=UPI0025BBB5D7|nr:hypothetical protein [Clostridium sp.]MCH3962804.1 hypothetical protein [Clostridium sp.]MCI1715781.1 hypothetical protein [Clostridium sp.]MCI1800014.1 hypothetical protein [Clostridium sp.]MCI1813928.1 hypothetical protein [Clostridium sp.]MCI1870826.1 hypothetical protein [Clostridium sp.]